MKQYYEKFHAQIWQHAYREAPNECCGVITNDSYLPCKNISSRPDKEFKIDPKVMVDVFRENNLQALVHSHVDQPHASLDDMRQQYEMAVPWGIACIDKMQQTGIYFWGDQLEIQDFEERPFVHGIYDCYSLIRDWFRENKGVWLPHVNREPYWWDRRENIIEDNFPKYKFKPVKSKKMLKVGDVLMFKIRSQYYNHLAVYIGKEQMLHHVVNKQSKKQSIYPWLYSADVVRYFEEDK